MALTFSGHEDSFLSLKGRLLKTLIACDASSCFVLPRSAIQSSGCTEEGKEYGTTVPQNFQTIWHHPLKEYGTSAPFKTFIRIWHRLLLPLLKAGERVFKSGFPVCPPPYHNQQGGEARRWWLHNSRLASLGSASTGVASQVPGHPFYIRTVHFLDSNGPLYLTELVNCT